MRFLICSTYVGNNLFLSSDSESSDIIEERSLDPVVESSFSAENSYSADDDDQSFYEKEWLDYVKRSSTENKGFDDIVHPPKARPYYDLVAAAIQYAGLIRKPHPFKLNKLLNIKSATKNRDKSIAIQLALSPYPLLQSLASLELLCRSKLPALKRKKKKKKLCSYDLINLKKDINYNLTELSTFKIKINEDKTLVKSELKKGGPPEEVELLQFNYHHYSLIDYLVNSIGQTLVQLLIIIKKYISTVYSTKKDKYFAEKQTFHESVYLLFLPKTAVERKGGGWLDEASRYHLGLFDLNVIKKAFLFDNFVLKKLGIDTETIAEAFVNQVLKTQVHKPILHTNLLGTKNLFKFAKVFIKNFKKIVLRNLLIKFNYNAFIVNKEFKKLDDQLKEVLPLFNFTKFNKGITSETDELNVCGRFNKLFKVVLNYNLP